MHVLGRSLAEMGCGREIVLGSLPEQARKMIEAGTEGLFWAGHIDATHDVGIRHIDVKTLDPDFLIFPTYKWVLGPYGRAFMYVAKRHQHGVPLEQTAPARKAESAITGKRPPVSFKQEIGSPA